MSFRDFKASNGNMQSILTAFERAPHIPEAFLPGESQAHERGAFISEP